MTSLYDISWNFKVIEHRVNMNRFVNNFTQWVSSRNLTNPGVGSEEIPNFENNDHPNKQISPTMPTNVYYEKLKKKIWVPLPYTVRQYLTREMTNAVHLNDTVGEAVTCVGQTDQQTHAPPAELGHVSIPG